jgi:putative DNA primase/helicase
MTVHDCEGKEARDFTYQEVIPFDIDHIDVSKIEQTAHVVCEAIGIDFAKTGIVFSGHGLQLFVQNDERITDGKFFVENRALYKFILQRIAAKLAEKGLAGTPDPAVFSMRRLMRMPGTLNRKPDLPDVYAYVVNKHIEDQGFSLATACGAPALSSRDSVNKSAWRVMANPDTETILQECRFLVHAKENQELLSEPEWYAMLGVIGFLKDGKNLAHEYSNKYSKYSEHETNFKVEMAVKTTGPRTCVSIDALWGKCSTCPHFKKVTTPCQLKSESFIETESTGFYHIKIASNGSENRVPAYEDLIKFFKKKEGKFFSPTRGVFYVYSEEKKHWEAVDETKIKNFAYKCFNPSARSSIVHEFANTMSHAEYMGIDWMQENSMKKLNMQNGVLDIETGVLHPHSDKYGFLSILPYAYDPDAKSPKFDAFMRDISCGDAQMVQVLLEFMGYAISGDECFIHKALILLGEGANGKSTFNKVLKALVGPGYFSTLNMKALQNDQNRAMLEGKLFNIGDENSPAGMIDADIFKVLTSGEHYTLKEVYKKPLSVRNKTKLIFNCNELPDNVDTTYGFYRRLLVIPFKATFRQGDSKTDTMIEYKLYEELPGILNKCLKAYKTVIKNKYFSPLESAEEIVKDLVDSQDEVRMWYYTTLTQDPSAPPLTLSEVYANYRQYCDREKLRARSNVGFGRKLAAILPNSRQLDRVQTGGTRARTLLGHTMKRGF